MAMHERASRGTCIGMLGNHGLQHIARFARIRRLREARRRREPMFDRIRACRTITAPAARRAGDRRLPLRIGHRDHRGRRRRLSGV